MQRSIRRTFLLLTVLLVAALSFPVGSQTPAPPDFSNVSDILSGRRTLFPVDDLMVNYQNVNQTVWPKTIYTWDGKIASWNDDCNYGTSGQGIVNGIGRMFNQPKAVEVTVTGAHIVVTTMGDTLQSPCGAQQFIAQPIGVPPAPGQFPQGDFNGDGFADFALLLNGQPYPLSAVDVNNPQAGVQLGQPGAVADPTQPVVALAVGDFDGDGKDELARVSASMGSNSIITVTIYRAQPGSNGALQFVSAGSTDFQVPPLTTDLAVVAGAFDAALSTAGFMQDRLLIAYSTLGIANTLVSLSVTASSSNPAAMQITVNDSQLATQLGGTLAGFKAGRLDFFSPAEQVVIGTTEELNDEQVNTIAVVTLDAALGIHVSTPTKYSGGLDPLIELVQQADLAIGNFDQPSGADAPLAMQIGVLVVILPGRSDAQLGLMLLDVDTANNFAVATPTRQDLVSIGPLVDGPDVIPTLSAGDVQGRSMLLGEPTKITVQHTQPKVVLGMPPMHVDWITPAGGSQPDVLNLSAILGGFYTSYQTSVTNSAQSSSKATTSWTNAVQTTLTEGYSWGNAVTGSVSVTATQSAGYLHKNTVSTQHDTYTSTQFDVSAGTGFDDTVWYVNEQHNIYIYPVIGETACPADKADCTDAERLPVTLILSGPDQIDLEHTTGATLEWFQPAWEPGNVFSYPWSLALMTAQDSTLSPLTSPASFSTDSSALTEHATWANQSGTTSTSGTVNNVSWGASLSISTSPPKATGGFSGSASVSYNGSKAMSTLNTSITTVGESTGIGIVKPGSFANPDNYQYTVLPYVLGNTQPDGTFDSVALATDVKTNGILQAAFAADPTAASAGSWWRGAYQLPDIALNHPSRWNVETLSGGTTPNCLRVGNATPTVSCATFNALDASADGLWNSEGLWMKGLLITPAGAPADSPQIAQAAAGDAVRLQARVYNYSLADMPPGSEVVVQFYGQPWNTANNTLAGDAFLIENVSLGPIPGFKSPSNGGTVANWRVAETTSLDTASYADQHLIFWVLVVPKDAQGPLPEMPDHGMYGIPPTLSSITDAASWIEPYSNNLGYYHSVFYIGPSSTTSSEQARPGTATGPGSASSKLPSVDLKATALAVTQFAATPARATLNQKVSVSARLHADAPLEGLTVTMYDGIPSAGGLAFDHESISHLRANEDYEIRVPFRPKTCGLHTLSLRTRSPAVTATTTLDVVADPLPFVRDLIVDTGSLGMRGSDRLHLVGLLHEAERMLVQMRDIEFAVVLLAHYRGEIASMRGNMIPAPQADALLSKTDVAASCAGIGVPALAAR